ncbi:hypothetical protein SLE2022_134750 [Rubroshorea leprosula]
MTVREEGKGKSGQEICCFGSEKTREKARMRIDGVAPTMATSEVRRDRRAMGNCDEGWRKDTIEILSEV